MVDSILDSLYSDGVVLGYPGCTRGVSTASAVRPCVTTEQGKSFFKIYFPAFAFSSSFPQNFSFCGLGGRKMHFGFQIIMGKYFAVSAMLYCSWSSGRSRNSCYLHCFWLCASASPQSLIQVESKVVLAAAFFKETCSLYSFC